MGFWDKLSGDLLKNEAENSTDAAHSTDLAACVLLLEIAHADDEFTDAEAQRLHSILQGEFNLNADEAQALTQQAEAQRRESLDLYQFTETLNSRLSKAHRMRIVRRLWEVVYADGRLDGHEDHLMHRLGELLNLEHRDLIEAKLAAKRTQ